MADCNWRIVKFYPKQLTNEKGKENEMKDMTCEEVAHDVNSETQVRQF